MQNKTPFDWFEEYQWDMDWFEWVKLYDMLTEEEEEEFQEAIANKNVVEMYDAVVDIIWVRAWVKYFYNKWEWKPALKEGDFDDFYYNDCDYIVSMFWLDCVNECLQEVLRSNFTKSKELAKDWDKIWKVIKWPNYSRPNLEPILKEYWML